MIRKVRMCGSLTGVLLLLMSVVFTSSVIAVAAPSTFAGVPLYQPSTLTSRTASSYELLRSPSQPPAINAFYLRAFSRAGWSITSHFASPYSAHFVARRFGQGVTVSISRAGTGSSISISVYRAPR